MNRKINHIQERALRIVYNDYISTFDELLIKDKTVSIHYRNLRQLAIEMYKVYKGISPPFMQELFTYVEGRRTRTGGDHFLRPNVNTVNMGNHSLRTFGPILWNTLLPENLKASDSLEKFKEGIKSWVPNNCNCKLCKTYIEGVGYVNIFE